MEGVPGDLQAKYQKIATEYAKMRAQASVLKKAVVEEQTRNSELRDALKEREQSLRKVEQEMDSLTFRNQQLTKRVTVLQDELDLMQARPKKGKSKGLGASPNTELTNHVLDEELQKKIAENAYLLSMVGVSIPVSKVYYTKNKADNVVFPFCSQQLRAEFENRPS